MKKFLLPILLVLASFSFAQVAVNTDGSSPDNSSILDIKSNSKGLLAPRMTAAQRMSISNPAFGLIVYQTDGDVGLYHNAGSPAYPYWTMVGANTPPWLWNGNSIYYTDGFVGMGTDSPSSVLQVNYDFYNYTNIGFSQYIQDHIIHVESDQTDGQTGIYSIRTRTTVNSGISYGISGGNSAIVGYSYWGDVYSFGISGFNYNDYTRCGGILGSQESGMYWGSLGYKNSGGTTYGGYFTSSSNGTGKSSQAHTSIGMGAYGDLMGAHIHGNIYGTFTQGEQYALYADGDVYRNGLDVHLQGNGSESQTVLYTSVSSKVTVQTSGYATLSNGKAIITFDPAFAEAVSTDEPIVVTITPTGNSNGVYLAEVSATGCKVLENNAGKNTVSLSYIAIGNRKGYEEPELSTEVTSAGYKRKISTGLNDDGNTQKDAEGLYYENQRLMTGQHPSTFPDPGKPAYKPVDPKTNQR
ncbi:MAG: hypothetical protein IPH84_14210 [Bacteroidales bacterium]|nr:hypothetical protein [Bacteroidales bacterium]